jgi:hypothetical protein
MIGLNKSLSVGKDAFLRPMLKYCTRYFSTTQRAEAVGNKTENAGQSPKWKYLIMLALGATGIYIAEKFDLRSKMIGAKPKTNSADKGPLLKLDLNEIYETGAVLFMTNKEVFYSNAI